MKTILEYLTKQKISSMYAQCEPCKFKEDYNKLHVAPVSANMDDYHERLELTLRYIKALYGDISKATYAQFLTDYYPLYWDRKYNNTLDTRVIAYVREMYVLLILKAFNDEYSCNTVDEIKKFQRRCMPAMFFTWMEAIIRNDEKEYDVEF